MTKKRWPPHVRVRSIALSGQNKLSPLLSKTQRPTHHDDAYGTIQRWTRDPIALPCVCTRVGGVIWRVTKRWCMTPRSSGSFYNGFISLPLAIFLFVLRVFYFKCFLFLSLSFANPLEKLPNFFLQFIIRILLSCVKISFEIRTDVVISYPQNCGIGSGLYIPFDIAKVLINQ